MTFYLGPVSHLQDGTSGYLNWDESHLYFANYLSGGIGNRMSIGDGNRSYIFHLEIPIVSAISRPELNRQYKIDDMSFGGIVSNLVSNPAAFNDDWIISTPEEENIDRSKLDSAFRLLYSDNRF